MKHYSYNFKKEILLINCWALLGIADYKAVRKRTCGRVIVSQAKRFLFESGIAINDQQSP